MINLAILPLRHDMRKTPPARKDQAGHELNILSLLPDRLFARVPQGVYVGEPAVVPSLFLWRSAALNKARGHVVAFFRDDEVFAAVVANPDKYAELFLRHGVAGVCELDVSLWRDSPLQEQRK